jgi:thioredoxin 1
MTPTDSHLLAEPTRATKPGARAAVLVLVAVGIVGALVLRRQRAEPIASETATEQPATVPSARLVELGSTSCTSCKAMHEELALLREECGTSIVVEEIDVWRDEAAGQRYGVSVIPTQVFLDAEGRELDRHVGFIARSDIRTRFAAHGVECQP